MDQKTLLETTSEHFEIRIWGDSNPKFIPLMKPCTRCGDQVAGQALTISKKSYEHRAQFWEIRCNSCEFRTTVKDLAKFKQE